MRNEGILWHLFCIFNATVNCTYKIHSSENVFTFSEQATFDRLHLFYFVFMPWVKMVSFLNEYCY